MAENSRVTDAQRSCLQNLCKQAEKPFPKRELTRTEADRMIDLLSAETGIGTETG
jgi:hypothetical protein